MTLRPETEKAIDELIRAARYDGANACNGAHPHLAEARVKLLEEIHEDMFLEWEAGRRGS
jgi:hypothetical protein